MPHSLMWKTGFGASFGTQVTSVIKRRARSHFGEAWLSATDFMDELGERDTLLTLFTAIGVSSGTAALIVNKDLLDR